MSAFILFTTRCSLVTKFPHRVFNFSLFKNWKSFVFYKNVALKQGSQICRVHLEQSFPTFFLFCSTPAKKWRYLGGSLASYLCIGIFYNWRHPWHQLTAPRLKITDLGVTGKGKLFWGPQIEKNALRAIFCRRDHIFYLDSWIKVKKNSLKSITSHFFSFWKLLWLDEHYSQTTCILMFGTPVQHLKNS